MKIKTKLTLGVGLLFGLIILLGVVGAVYIHALKADTESILEDNYNTLEYAHGMLAAIDDPHPKSPAAFERNLAKQEKSITEIGEKALTQKLRSDFNNFRLQKTDSSQLAIRASLFGIMDLNMQAIQRKSEFAGQTAQTATLWIAVSGMLCFLIAFILLVNLPSNIANPIRDLASSIRQIAEKKYTERVHFESHNEFGDLARSFNTMAKKLEEYNSSNLAKIMMEKKRIETLISNMHDPVIGLDEQGIVIFANEEALQVIGLQADALIGKAGKDIALQNDLVRQLIRDIATAGGQQPTLREKPLKIYAHGRESYFEKEILDISIVPTGETEKLLIGQVILLRNVTEYKELDAAKTNFIATVSHEFKTPIAAIKMSLQLLGNERIGPLNEEQDALLQSITDDADRLLKITGELLNMTQVESGNIQLVIGAADVPAMLQDALEATKVQAEQKGIRLETHFAENLPKAQADSDKTTWVLTNLISNAIRYAHPDTVVSLEASSEGNKIHFAVRDSGPGIAPQYLDKVFDRYFRVPGTNQPGTGLGLSISKEFIEAQNGMITVDSTLGVGSTFTVVLQAVSGKS